MAMHNTVRDLPSNVSSISLINSSSEQIFNTFTSISVTEICQIIIIHMQYLNSEVPKMEGRHITGRVLYKPSYPAAWHIISPMVTKSVPRQTHINIWPLSCLNLVISLCHQYRARPACTSVQSDQALYCWQIYFKFSSWNIL